MAGRLPERRAAAPAASEATRNPAPAPQVNMGMGVNLPVSPAAAREIATVQAQMVVAKAYPRYLPDVYRRLDQVCASPKLANMATYAYARGGTDIQGPTIRLAEAVANNYMNMKFGSEVTDRSNGESTVRAYAFDMETNTLAERTFRVPHFIQTKAGRKELTDPRDIYELEANQASRRIRACILEIVPGDVVEYAVDLCQKTRTANIDKSPEKMSALLKAFRTYEIGKADIEAFIQRKFEAITDSQWLRLQDIYRSLRDGMARKEDFFKGMPAQEGIVIDEQTGEVLNAPGPEAAASDARKAEERISPEKPETIPKTETNAVGTQETAPAGPEAFDDSGDFYDDSQDPDPDEFFAGHAEEEEEPF